MLTNKGTTILGSTLQYVHYDYNSYYMKYFNILQLNYNFDTVCQEKIKPFNNQFIKVAVILSDYSVNFDFYRFIKKLVLLYKKVLKIFLMCTIKQTIQ